MTTITLKVCRRLDNRLEGLGDKSPRALELHRMRSRALHEVFDQDNNWNVIWGDTDDTIPHEWVDLILHLKDQAISLAPHLVPALMFVGKAVVSAGISTVVAEAIKAKLAELRKKQEEKRIRDVIVKLPDGSSIDCHPDTNVVTVSLVSHISLNWNASRAELTELEKKLPTESPKNKT
jgi:hypothetical protein